MVANLLGWDGVSEYPVCLWSGSVQQTPTHRATCAVKQPELGHCDRHHRMGEGKEKGAQVSFLTEKNAVVVLALCTPAHLTRNNRETRQQL